MLFLLIQILLLSPVALGQYFSIAEPILVDYESTTVTQDTRHKNVFSYFLILDLDYYWRNYDGTIPKDAVNLDINNETLYIGQAMNHPYGTAVVPIFEGDETFTVNYNQHIQNVSQGIQILCSPHPENFLWKSVNAANFSIDMLKYYPIIGGVEDEESVLYIGKVEKNGKQFVGKIRQHLVASRSYKGMYEMQTRMSAIMGLGKKVGYFRKFEVLTYDDSSILARNFLSKSMIDALISKRLGVLPFKI